MAKDKKKEELVSVPSPLLRTRAHVDQEYSNEAMQLGHKISLRERLLAQIPLHRQKLVELAKESDALALLVAAAADKQ